MRYIQETIRRDIIVEKDQDEYVILIRGHKPDGTFRYEDQIPGFKTQHDAKAYAERIRFGV